MSELRQLPTPLNPHSWEPTPKKSNPVQLRAISSESKFAPLKQAKSNWNEGTSCQLRVPPGIATHIQICVVPCSQQTQEYRQENWREPWLTFEVRAFSLMHLNNNALKLAGAHEGIRKWNDPCKSSNWWFPLFGNPWVHANSVPTYCTSKEMLGTEIENYA